MLGKLIGWKNSKLRSPLLLVGSRQVGKTTILSEFLSKNSRQVMKVNFWNDRNNKFKRIFQENGEAKKIIRELEDLLSIDGFDPGVDSIFIDEIQECPEAYSSLKSFKEEYPGLLVVASGSYLQLFSKNNKMSNLPVGCVDEMVLKPLSFEEFLENIDSEVHARYEELQVNNFEVTSTLHDKLVARMNEYFFTGGLPELVAFFKDSHGNAGVRERIRSKQKTLVKQYSGDFQKYGKSQHVKKIDKLFSSIPYQLERVHDDTVRRFMYTELGKNANYSLFHFAFDYLEQAGLILRSFIVSRNDLSRRVHEKIEERNIFKCYYFDAGLLNAVLGIPADSLLKNLGSYKGYLAENFVATQLAHKYDLFSYRKNSKLDAAEVEFLLCSDDGGVVPVEVKSSMKSLKSKSLEYFIREFHPQKAYKLIPGRHHNASGAMALPLYMVGKI